MTVYGQIHWKHCNNSWCIFIIRQWNIFVLIDLIDWLKGWPSKKCELQFFVFQKVPIWQRPLANQLGGIEYNFRSLKRFFRKVRRKLRSAFSLKLRFLKIRLLDTWLKWTLFNFWDIRTRDTWNVCLKKYRNNTMC